MLLLDDDSIGLNLGIQMNIVSSKHWCARHVYLIKNFQPIFCGLSLQHLSHHLETLSGMSDKSSRILEARIFKPIAPIGGTAKSLPFPMGNG